MRISRTQFDTFCPLSNTIFEPLPILVDRYLIASIPATFAQSAAKRVSTYSGLSQPSPSLGAAAKLEYITAAIASVISSGSDRSSVLIGVVNSTVPMENAPAGRRHSSQQVK